MSGYAEVTQTYYVNGHARLQPGPSQAQNIGGKCQVLFVEAMTNLFSISATA